MPYLCHLGIKVVVILKNLRIIAYFYGNRGAWSRHLHLKGIVGQNIDCRDVEMVPDLKGLSAQSSRPMHQNYNMPCKIRND